MYGLLTRAASSSGPRSALGRVIESGFPHYEREHMSTETQSKSSERPSKRQRALRVGIRMLIVAVLALPGTTLEYLAYRDGHEQLAIAKQAAAEDVAGSWRELEARSERIERWPDGHVLVIRKETRERSCR